MNAVPGRWRRLAVKLAQHASWVLPGARSPWADAMRRELDYIGDDPAALRWALGCILASYKARLAHRPCFSARLSALADWRHVATSGVLMLLIGLALQENAGGQTEPPRPAFDETTCDLPGVSPEIRPRVPRDYDNSDACALRRISPCPSQREAIQSLRRAKVAADFIDQPEQAPDTSCADRIADPLPPRTRHSDD